jgi:hypothetical protein
MAGARPEAGRARGPGARSAGARSLLSLALGLAAGCGGSAAPADPLPPGDYTPRRVPSQHVMPAGQAARLRADALTRARVWRAPDVPVEHADLLHNPPDGFRATDEPTCRFLPRSSDGLTPKFDCVLAGGRVIKVKYGEMNHERLAEVAGSRLALALGFGADHMYVVRRVTCWGCPRYPYPRFPWLDALLADSSRARTFDHAVIEALFPGREIETPDREGWAWTELEQVDEARGGAPRAELDALRLFAVLLNHWDNKAENQRLTCLPGGEQPDGGCTAPFALIHDLGATFGPRRADLEAWRARPVWHDAASCTVSMRGLPFGGGTFTDRRIGEAGRRFFAAQVQRLRPAQLHDLFAGARFGAATGGEVEAWVGAFEHRVRQIVDRGPCPDA